METIYYKIIKILKKNNLNFKFFIERFPLTEQNYSKINYIFENINELIINPVHIVISFISNEECNQLIDNAKNRFVNPFVATEYANNPNKNLRSSKICYFSKSENEFIYKIEKKIATLLNININQIEPLKLNIYEYGDEFKLHYDFYPQPDYNERKYSFIIYLNTLENDGATYFPYYNARYYPKKGSAIHFKNFIDDDNIKTNLFSLHTGEKVLLNQTKYIITTWITQYEIIKKELSFKIYDEEFNNLIFKLRNKNINNNFINKIIKNKANITNKDYIDFINILN